MTKERFIEILKEYEFTDHQIDLFWETRPDDNLDEARLHAAALKCKKSLAAYQVW